MHSESTRGRRPARPRVERTCEHCGTQFTIKASVLEKGYGRFCNLACYWSFTASRICRQCGNPAWPRRHDLCGTCYYKAFSVERLKRNAIERRAMFIREGRCLQCGAERDNDTKLCSGCRERQARANAANRQAVKDAVFAAYGGYRCVCCGETEPLFLTLDHINGGGGKERRESGRELYRHILKTGIRSDLRVLCNNCNRGRWLNGGACPHEASRT